MSIFAPAPHRNAGRTGFTPLKQFVILMTKSNNLPFKRNIRIRAGIRTRIITVPVVKDHIRKAGDYVTLEEQRQAAIMNYVNLMRIKACETGTNKELDYQIKVARVILSNFGIDISELEL